MNLREEYARLARLRTIALQHPLPPERIAALIQPFIDRYKNLRLPRKADPVSPSTPVPHPHHEAIVSAIISLGISLRRARITGLAYHTSLQHAVADLAPAFHYRAFTECFASYDTDPAEGTTAHPGRMDVVWAEHRTPTVLFELDSTVKRISLQKLQLAAAPHKYWIYFGFDLWTFKTSLARWDPQHEIVPILIPTKYPPTL